MGDGSIDFLLKMHTLGIFGTNEYLNNLFVQQNDNYFNTNLPLVLP